MNVTGVEVTSVRRFEPEDAEALERIVTAAYERPVSPGMRARLTAKPLSALVAVRGAEVVGCVLVADYGTVGFVGSMAVDPSVRRTGVGIALMDALLATCDACGPHALALDATDMGAPLYERCGFIDVDRTLVFERDEPASRAPDRRPDAECVRRAIELDRALLGCDRSASLEMLLSEPGVTLSLDAGGYAMTRGNVVGPWLADGAAAAKKLFARALAANPGVWCAFVPQTNAQALAIVRDSGFEEVRTLRHMIRGSNVLPRAIIYGQASLGHG